MSVICGDTQLRRKIHGDKLATHHCVLGFPPEMSGS